MAENKFSCGGCGASREAFGMEVGRILDACRDRDCFEDIRVYLSAFGEDLIARTGNVRVKSARICGANIVTEPVQFNCGFYAVDVKFYIGVTFEVCVPLGTAQEFEGVAVVEKRVVLFGGESGMFSVLTPLSAASLLVFCLLYTPCVAAVAAVKRELGGKWAVGVALGQCVIAWICAFIVRMLGLLIGMA